MAEPSRPDPRAAAERVRLLARDVAQELAGGLRSSSRTVRLRAAVIGSWALLSLATLWAACPSSGPHNVLGAEVRVSEEVIGTQILVSNTSRGMWTDVVITLDGAWSHRIRTVREGQRLVLAASRFERDGAPAPADLKPASLTLECAQGRLTVPVARR